MYCVVPNHQLERILAENDWRRARYTGKEITEQIDLLRGSLQNWTVLALTAGTDGLCAVMTAEHWVDPTTQFQEYLGLPPQ